MLANDVSTRQTNDPPSRKARSKQTAKKTNTVPTALSKMPDPVDNLVPVTQRTRSSRATSWHFFLPALLRREYRFAFNRPARAVSPKPGVSCATASAPSFLERRRMTGDQDEDEAPKPWFMWRTHPGGVTPVPPSALGPLGSSRRKCTLRPWTSSKRLLEKGTLSGDLSLGWRTISLNKDESGRRVATIQEECLDCTRVVT